MELKPTNNHFGVLESEGIYTFFSDIDGKQASVDISKDEFTVVSDILKRLNEVRHEKET